MSTFPNLYNGNPEGVSDLDLFSGENSCLLIGQNAHFMFIFDEQNHHISIDDEHKIFNLEKIQFECDICYEEKNDVPSTRCPNEHTGMMICSGCNQHLDLCPFCRTPY